MNQLTEERKYPNIIRNIPTGLANAILYVLRFHQGKTDAVGREELLRCLADHDFPNASERIVRETIKILRRDGHLIGSLPGENGGYFMITDMKEYEYFREHEMMAKIDDMRSTVNKLDEAARRQFGTSPAQMSLIG